MLGFKLSSSTSIKSPALIGGGGWGGGGVGVSRIIDSTHHKNKEITSSSIRNFVKAVGNGNSWIL